MLKQNLGRIERVSVRSIWPSESGDFTPWLAENLHFLGEAIGTELELEVEEKSVGSFRADILAKDISTDSWVLIENQLGRTDHCHLGQLITYAAGLKAVTIVWIAEQFTDEHTAALDWLNTISDDSVCFFGVQVEVWSINESTAPKFNVVNRPNSWIKKGKKYKKTALLESPGERVQKFITEQLARGCKPTLGEIQEGCNVSKHTAIKYRRALLGDDESEEAINQ